MPFNPPVYQWYRIASDDGSPYGWFDTFLQVDRNGNLCIWSFHYRRPDKTSPPDYSHMCATSTGYESSIEFSDGQGSEEKAKFVFPDPMPPEAPEGAVGYVEWPGQPRRWLIPE